MNKERNQLYKSVNHMKNRKFIKKDEHVKDFTDIMIYKTNNAYTKIWHWIEIYAFQLGIVLLIIVILALIMVFRLI